MGRLYARLFPVPNALPAGEEERQAFIESLSELVFGKRTAIILTGGLSAMTAAEILIPLFLLPYSGWVKLVLCLPTAAFLALTL